MIDRRTLALRLAPLALVAALAVALMAPASTAIDLAGDEAGAAAQMNDALDAASEDALVVVGFDPDLGTYAEIRPTVRAVLADLLERDAAIAFVSLTPEGRALGVAELARLGRAELDPRRVTDLGFRPGAEAALVQLVSDVGLGAAEGEAAELLARDGLAAASLIYIVGGNELGPRAWVEQIATRLPDIPLVAVAPTMLHPELRPYLATEQLAGLLATVRDGAAYRASLELETHEALLETDPPGGLPMLIGMLAALLVLGHAVVDRTLAAMRARGWRGG